MTKCRVLVTTVPFGERDTSPLDILSEAGIEAVINPLGRKLQPGELETIIQGFDALVAGTEEISADAMDLAGNLKLISRVGIGLDGVDLLAAKKRNIAVTYTPDAPSAAVGEITIGLMLDMLRGISRADRELRDGRWHRIMGRRLAQCTVGIIGVGRCGKLTARHLANGFPGVRILANDLTPDREFGQQHDITWVDKETLYKSADVIVLHIPLTTNTRNLITRSEFSIMKSDAMLINPARGGIVNEADLLHALQNEEIGGAAIDVFDTEPYDGPLAQLSNCVVTSHMGSMSEDCRARMEIEACQEVARFFTGQPLRTPVPESEYEVAAAMRA